MEAAHRLNGPFLALAGVGSGMTDAGQAAARAAGAQLLSSAV